MKGMLWVQAYLYPRYYGCSGDCCNTGRSSRMPDNPAQGAYLQCRELRCTCRSMSRGRALSTAKPIEGSGLKNMAQKNKAIKMGDRAQRRMGKMARRGEADRHIPDLKPKHLMSGKRGIGKTDRR